MQRTDRIRARRTAPGVHRSERCCRGADRHGRGGSGPAPRVRPGAVESARKPRGFRRSTCRRLPDKRFGNSRSACRSVRCTGQVPRSTIRIDDRSRVVCGSDRAPECVRSSASSMRPASARRSSVAFRRSARISSAHSTVRILAVDRQRTVVPHDRKHLEIELGAKGRFAAISASSAPLRLSSVEKSRKGNRTAHFTL